jgi:serine/threonine-protein kinase
MNHPHICVLHDVGPDYLVMEYLEGAPLHGPLPLDDALRVGVGSRRRARGAHARHPASRSEAGQHHDDAHRHASCSTSALAKMYGRRGTTTPPDDRGTVLGTAAYMSPEQAQGSRRRALGRLQSRRRAVRAVSGGALSNAIRCSTRSAPSSRRTASLDSPARRSWHDASRSSRPSLSVDGRSEAALQQLRTRKPSGARAPSIAVLPFANMSRDADDEYFSDGLAEEVINALAQCPASR